MIGCDIALAISAAGFSLGVIGLILAIVKFRR